MTQEVLKLALEALNEWGKGFPDLVGDLDKQAINAIKEALAQPQQKRPQNCGTSYCSCIECVMEPPQRKPLMPISHERMTTREFKCFMLGWRGAEAAHDIKE